MSELNKFLHSQKSAGEYQGSGEFLISLQKAREKKATFALPQPELWIIRLLQGLSGLQATHVAIEQSRKGLRVAATSPQGIPPEFSLLDLFRQKPSTDPRPAIQDSIWGAVGKNLRVRLWWKDGETTRGFLVDKEQLELISGDHDLDTADFVMEVEPTKRTTKLLRIFGIADFSKEFHAISHRGLLAPYILTIDNRPLELSTAYFARGQQNWEVRYHRATEGPRLRGGFRSQFLTTPEVANLNPELSESQDALFLLAIHWNPQSAKRPSVHWVQDGFIVESESLGQRDSNLQLELYLPADELQTDLSGLKLISSKAKQERLQDFELQACLSLASHPICWNPGLPLPPRGKISKEIGQYFADVFARIGLAGKQLQKFQNMTKMAQAHQRKVGAENQRRMLVYQTELANYQAKLRDPSRQFSSYQSITNLAELRKQDARRLAQNLNSGGHWARLDSNELVQKLDGLVEGAEAGGTLLERPVLDRLPVKSLLGEVYVSFFRPVIPKPPVLPAIRGGKRKRTRSGD